MTGTIARTMDEHVVVVGATGYRPGIEALAGHLVTRASWPAPSRNGRLTCGSVAGHAAVHG